MGEKIVKKVSKEEFCKHYFNRKLENELLDSEPGEIYDEGIKELEEQDMIEKQSNLEDYM